MKLYLLPVVYSLFSVARGGKADVADDIAADTLPSCSVSRSMHNCMTEPADGATTNYSPNDITFTGITVSEDGNSCCYNYKSVKTSRLDCTGKSPAQSHWNLMTRFEDCTFQITSTTPDNGVGFGADKSTCTEGIKFDVGCEGECDYQVCLDFCNFGGNLTPESCCTKQGWFMTKSGTGYDFGSIEVPSCVCESETPCETDVKLNIAFLLDESGSIDEVEWEVVTEFVATVIEMDLATDSYVALYEYASLAAFQKLLDFTHVPEVDRSAITDVLRNNRYNSGGQTYTWDAVSRVLDDFWDYRFGCTDGCETRSDVLFVITDGAPTDEVCPKMLTRLQATPNVDIVVVVVGEGGNGNVDWYSAISCLDINDNGNDIFLVPSFTAENFNAIQQRIRAKTCQNGADGTPVGRPEANTEWNYEQECYCGGEGLGPVPERTPNEGPCAGSGGSCDQAKNDFLSELLNEPAKDAQPVHAEPVTAAWWNVYALGFMSCYAILMTAVVCVYLAVKCGRKQKTVHDHEEVAVNSE